MKIDALIKSAQAKALVLSDERAAIVAKGDAMTDTEVSRGLAIATELKALEDRIAVLKAQEAAEAAQAVAVPATETGAAAAVSKGITVTSNAPKGSAFTRTAMVLAKAKGNLAVAQALAETHYKDDAVVNGIVKAAVSAGSTQVAEWAGNLIYPENYAGDFIELLYPQTVLGRLSLRKVPFNIRIQGQTGGTSVGWVGEARPAPVTSAKFNDVFLTWAKVRAISVMSNELIRFSNPAAEALVQADLLKATAQGIDVTFLGNAAAVQNVSPAGMLYNVTPVAASGTTPEALVADVQALVAPFIAANYDMSSAKLVMSPARALAIASIRTTQGQKYFPDMTMNGGTLEGLPVITSNNASGSQIILIIQSEIFLSEDAGPQIDISTEASIIMDSAPASATANPVNMFQNDLVAIKIGQFMNWQKRRDLAVGYISNAAYTNPVPAAASGS